jgi:hypothetical protein
MYHSILDTVIEIDTGNSWTSALTTKKQCKICCRANVTGDQDVISINDNEPDVVNISENFR